MEDENGVDFTLEGEAPAIDRGYTVDWPVVVIPAVALGSSGIVKVVERQQLA